MAPVFLFFSLSLPSLALLLLIILLSQINQGFKNFTLPPGPRKLPILGNLHQLTSPLHQSLLQLSLKHGPLMYLQLGFVPAIVVSSAKLAEEVLKTHDHESCSRPSLVSFRKLSYNSLDVALSPYGDYWRQMRKICILELLSPNRVQSFRSIREEEVSRTMSNIAQQNSGLVDLSEMTHSLANNVTCRVALGKRYHFGEDGEKGKLHELFNEAQAMFGGFFAADYFPAATWVDVLRGQQGKLKKIFDELDDFYEIVISEHLHPKKPRQDQEDFVDVLLRVQGDYHLTKDHIKGVLMNVFIGGTDTSSSVILWAMAELMRNKRVMNKAQEEVRRIVGRKGKVEETDIKELHYLRLILKETLRLHPPNPLLIPHELIKECSISGFLVSPKTRLIINVFAIGRDPLAWDRPNEFIPERFLDSPTDYKGLNFELLPFGSGRRRCPGMHLGLAIVELALAHLLYLFDWKLPLGITEQDLDMSEENGLTVHKKSPLLVKPTAYKL